MSHVVRKPVFAICEQQRRRSEPVASFCGCTGWFETTLVANPDDRFSRDEAQIKAFNQLGNDWPDHTQEQKLYVPEQMRLLCYPGWH